MAFIDDQIAIIGNCVRDVPVADQALDERDFDDAGRIAHILAGLKAVRYQIAGRTIV
ncbi:unnamed protein product [Acidocella sp. C78]|uniref:hypothetical protein n=1 Tax=Acidocella sp. C78 TaxID=1671486 RepID=UPI001BBE824F|nr:hypothetical protein [Acidocella sp. C78]CAG4901047.1 unnamed protein product [Acidocella sp. C78]